MMNRDGNVIVCQNVVDIRSTGTHLKCTPFPDIPLEIHVKLNNNIIWDFIMS